jgi:hypothetical protein
MQHRRQLIEGLAKALPEIDANAAAQFIAGDNAVSAKPVATTPDRTLRTPLTTRLRKDIGDALKRASLERQLRDRVCGDNAEGATKCLWKTVGR